MDLIIGDRRHVLVRPRKELEPERRGRFHESLTRRAGEKIECPPAPCDTVKEFSHTEHVVSPRECRPRGCEGVRLEFLQRGLSLMCLPQEREHGWFAEHEPLNEPGMPDRTAEGNISTVGGRNDGRRGDTKRLYHFGEVCCVHGKRIRVPRAIGRVRWMKPAAVRDNAMGL